jgi:hypothetical protein
MFFKPYTEGHNLQTDKKQQILINLSFTEKSCILDLKVFKSIRGHNYKLKLNQIRFLYENYGRN